ncbi:MAG: hypothetical protein ACOH19_02600 [Rhodoglobus sp.]
MMLTPRVFALTAILPVLVLAGCSATPAPGSTISSVSYSQSQAIANFDGATYEQDAAAELDRLEQLLDQYDVAPGVTDITPDESCDGGRSTNATLSYSNGTTAELVVEACGDGAYEEFNSAASDLFSEWHDAAH